MCKFWHDYIHLERREKGKLCYMDSNNIRVYIKTEEIYSDISKDVETRLDSLNYELDRPLSKGKK